MPPVRRGPGSILFWLPVTKAWLWQRVLGLTLTCHSSRRGVQELLADRSDYPLSLGAIHAEGPVRVITVQAGGATGRGASPCRSEGGKG